MVNANVHEFIPWVLQFGSDAEVLEPKSVRDMMRIRLAESRERYA